MTPARITRPRPFMVTGALISSSKSVPSALGGACLLRRLARPYSMTGSFIPDSKCRLKAAFSALARAFEVAWSIALVVDTATTA